MRPAGENGRGAEEGPGIVERMVQNFKAEDLKARLAGAEGKLSHVKEYL